MHHPIDPNHMTLYPQRVCTRRQFPSSMDTWPLSHSLPPEIWGHVFRYVDTFTLWTTCRQVSRLLRQEAEGEVARTRLSALSIQWSGHNLLDRWQEVPVLKTSKFLGLSLDRSRAHFSLWSGYRDCSASGTPSPEIKGFDNVPWDAAHTERVLTEAVKFSDLEFLDRCFQRLPWRMVEINFDGYINDPDIPGLSISKDWKELSFDWRELLTRFYLDEQYVCSLKRGNGRRRTVLPYPERAAKSLDTPEQREAWCCRAQWERHYAKEDAHLYAKAYLRRVERSYHRAGKPFSIGHFTPKAHHEFQHDLNTLRYYRNEAVMRRLVADRPTEFLQMREIC